MALVKLDMAEGVATLTLDDPDRRNVLTTEMVAEMVSAIDGVEADLTIGAVVVTGAGSAFCAGAELGHLADVTAESLKAVYEGFMRVARCTLPTVAAVNGPAVGAGMNLALACDVRVAARRARFDTRFLQIGLHPGGGHTWMLQRLAGTQTAMAAVLFGEVLDGAAAERVGLAHRCVDDELVVAAATEMAARAARAPRELAIAAKRTIIDMASVATHDEAVARELEPQLWSARQPWFVERLAALQQVIDSRNRR